VFLREDALGEQTVPGVAEHLRPDILFVFNDPQNLVHLCVPARQRRHKLLLYINYDGIPLPPIHGPALNQADRIITMCDFSKQVVLSCLPAVRPDKLDSLYSPAGIKRFSPRPVVEGAEGRRELLPEWMPPDSYVLGWVGRNQWRKQGWLPYQLIHHLRTGDYWKSPVSRAWPKSRRASCTMWATC
jgi:hypothetical protein